MSAPLTRGSRWWAKTILSIVAAGFLLLWIGVEITIREVTNTPWMIGDPMVIVDRFVGRIPREGFHMQTPFFPVFAMTIKDHGTRGNGSDPPGIGRPLTLAVGDSFTFGEGESDDRTWPAILEMLRNRPVINAGIPGFGIDQAVLRAENLTPIYHPDVLVLSFIPDDVRRAEAKWLGWNPKPYFQLDGQGLRLFPMPTPTSATLDSIKQLFRSSIVLRGLFDAPLREGPYCVAVHADGNEVACRLMDRLAVLGRIYNVRVVVFAQMQTPMEPPENVATKDYVLACARTAGLTTVDMFPLVDELPPPDRRKLFHQYGPTDFGHMNLRGNLFAARALERILPDGM
jgi:hypothetical protein